MCYRKRQCNDAGLTEVGGARGLYLNVGEVGLRRRKEKEKGSMRTGAQDISWTRSSVHWRIYRLLSIGWVERKKDDVIYSGTSF
jgi:hypothetical protein